MKRLIIAITLLATSVFGQTFTRGDNFGSAVYRINSNGNLSIVQAPTVPSKAFDVRESNGIVDQGTTYPASLVIPFKDSTAEQKFYDDYAANNNWTNANPQPTKKKFALDGIKQFMKDQSSQGRNKVVVIPVPDVSDLP